MNCYESLMSQIKKAYRFSRIVTNLVDNLTSKYTARSNVQSPTAVHTLTKNCNEAKNALGR